MAWIELHQAVWTHRKTFELASILGIEDTYAAAHVIRLWSWALDNAPDGDLSHLSSRAIAYGAGWRGSSETLLSGLLNVGWLNPDHTIHDWHEYAGRLVERREKDAVRKRLERQSAAGRQDVPGTSNGTATGVRRTVPDRTGPDTTGPDLTPTPQPPSPQAGQGEPRNPGRRSRGSEVRGEDAAALASPPEVAEASPKDRQLWDSVRERLRTEMSAPNWDHLVEPLVVLGRTADGALCLRAPPDVGARMVRPAVAKALLDAGDVAASGVVIFEAVG